MLYIVGRGFVAKALASRLDQEYVMISRKDYPCLPAMVKPGDVIINAASTELNEELLTLCVRKKCDYLDMGSDMKDGECEQWRYSEMFRFKGLRGVFNAGLAPGLTNILARRAYEEGLREFRFRYLEKVGPKPVFLWNPYISTADKKSMPVRWQSGRIVSYPRERFPFVFPGEGQWDVISFLHDEVASIGRALYPRIVEVAIGGALECDGVFSPEMWGKEVKEMVFLACLEGYDTFLRVDYAKLREKGIEENVIAFGTAFFCLELLKIWDNLERTLCPPELLPADVIQKLWDRAKHEGLIL